MSTTVILGGGFGGLAAARTLRAHAPDPHRVVLVDRAPGFLVGSSKISVMLGERRVEDVVRARSQLLPAGITLLQGDVLAVDASRREVETTAGDLQADQLVIALGTELDMAAVPGLAGAAHSFYSLMEALRLRDALESFAGGRLVLLLPRIPIKCPPAPYEAALLLHAWLARRGLRARTDFAVWTVETAPMTTAGPRMGQRIAAELAERGIGLHTAAETAAVDGGRRVVRLADAREVPYDLLIAVPPHRVSGVAAAAGLAPPGGWIPVDPKTLEVKAGGAAAQVYAIGDVAGVALPGRFDPERPLSLPKAGTFAAAQGEVVGERIASALRGEPVTATFDGRGYCFIETGEGRAVRAEGAFFELPHPRMTAGPADEAQYADKRDWEQGWLKSWR